MSYDLAVQTSFPDRPEAGRCLVEPLTRFAGRSNFG